MLGRLAAEQGRRPGPRRAGRACSPVIGGRLVIIGEGPQREELAARRVPGVEFRGHVSHEEKLDLLSSAWLLVHGAHHEGWCIAVTEAAALATPALAYDVDGVRDSVVDGVTGELVHDESDLVERVDQPGARPRPPGPHGACRPSSLPGLQSRALGRRVARGRPRHRGCLSVSEVVELRSPHPTGLARSAQLLRLYRREPVDPAPFYEFLADDTVEVLRRHGADVDGLVIDVGGGPGYLADAIRHGGGTLPRRRVRRGGAAPPRAHPRRCRRRRRSGPAAPFRRGRRRALLERARARRPPPTARRRDGEGAASRWDRVPLLHALVVPVGRARDIAVALRRWPTGRRPLPTPHRARGEEPLRPQPVRAAPARPCGAGSTPSPVWRSCGRALATGPRAWGPLCRIPGVGEVISWNYLAVLRRVS